jgi:dienelactone hydrolase
MISKKIALGCAGLMALAAGYANAQAVGDAPTLANSQLAGPFAVTTQRLTGSGFGGGTIYVPTGAGASPLIALCPGFTASQTSVQTQARRIASYGFVVATIDTNSRFDFPASRGTQLQAAIRALQAVGGAAGAVANDDVLGVGGHSMGGGGTLFALRAQANLRAGVPFAPFSTSNPFGQIQGNRFITITVGTADNVAPANQHSIPFFNATTAANNSTLCIITGAGHSFVSENPVHQPSSRLAVATFQVALRGDTRWLPILNDGTGCGSGFRQ